MITMTIRVAMRMGTTNRVTIMGMPHMVMSTRIPRNTLINTITVTRTSMLRMGMITDMNTVIPTTTRRALKTRRTPRSLTNAGCRTCAVS